MNSHIINYLVKASELGVYVLSFTSDHQTFTLMQFKQFIKSLILKLISTSQLPLHKSWDLITQQFRKNSDSLKNKQVNATNLALWSKYSNTGNISKRNSRYSSQQLGELDLSVSSVGGSSQASQVLTIDLHSLHHPKEELKQKSSKIGTQSFLKDEIKQKYKSSRRPSFTKPVIQNLSRTSSHSNDKKSVKPPPSANYFTQFKKAKISVQKPQTQLKMKTLSRSPPQSILGGKKPSFSNHQPGQTPRQIYSPMSLRPKPKMINPNNSTESRPHTTMLQRSKQSQTPERTITKGRKGSCSIKTGSGHAGSNNDGTIKTNKIPKKSGNVMIPNSIPAPVPTSSSSGSNAQYKPQSSKDALFSVFKKSGLVKNKPQNQQAGQKKQSQLSQYLSKTSPMKSIKGSVDESRQTQDSKTERSTILICDDEYQTSNKDILETPNGRKEESINGPGSNAQGTAEKLKDEKVAHALQFAQDLIDNHQRLSRICLGLAYMLSCKALIKINMNQLEERKTAFYLLKYTSPRANSLESSQQKFLSEIHEDSMEYDEIDDEVKFGLTKEELANTVRTSIEQMSAGQSKILDMSHSTGSTAYLLERIKDDLQNDRQISITSAQEKADLGRKLEKVIKILNNIKENAEHDAQEKFQQQSSQLI